MTSQARARQIEVSGLARVQLWLCLLGVSSFLAGGCASGDVAIPVLAMFRLHNDQVESYGQFSSDRGSGFAKSVSDQFGTNELRQLFKRLNSGTFQSELSRYNCGDPVPQFHFHVTLYRQSSSGARRVEVSYWPELSVDGRTRCLCFGMDYLAGKIFAEIQPARMIASPEPHCDCENRDSGQEWVTFTGPGEKP